MQVVDLVSSLVNRFGLWCRISSPFSFRVQNYYIWHRLSMLFSATPFIPMTHNDLCCHFFLPVSIWTE